MVFVLFCTRYFFLIGSWSALADPYQSPIHFRGVNTLTDRKQNGKNILYV